jgi:ketosteroid isomerase-like protein
MTDTTRLIHRYFELAARADAPSYFAQFTEDATVEDEGVQRNGLDAIRAWRTEVPRVVYEVHEIVTADSGHVAHVDIAGDFPGQPGSSHIPF